MKNLAFKVTPMEEDLPLEVGAAGYDIRPLASKLGGYELTIRGFLAPGWTGRLAAALAKHRMGIVRGKAEKVTMTSWSSSFELNCTAPHVTPLHMDYLALAATELPCDRSLGKPSLTDFLMEPCNRHEGSLYVEVTALDRLGFLGDLLDYFSMRCLFPVKMSVETVAGMAVDRFWLRGIGGSVPSDGIAGSMRESLEQLLER